MKKPITFRGKSFESKAALAKHYGVSADLLYSRICIGWILEQALELEPAPEHPSSAAVKVTFRGKTFESKKLLAAHYGLEVGLFIRRLQRGWAMEEALGLKPRLGFETYKKNHWIMAVD